MNLSISNEELAKRYSPHEIEAKWYPFWEEHGYFKPSEDDNAEMFCIVIPPPNVTGVLHIGHALDNTIQDILIRWHRMMGHNTLWLPGTDHAGISTQMVVERALKEQEGLARNDLGREKFLERVWEWKEKHGSEIINQLRKLGASCDWERERFTMDEGLSKAVRRVFVDLFNEGLIYRGDYLVNWDCVLQTAVSDLEVVPKETKGNLWFIKYKIKDEDACLTIATTRPETLLGDTALAVNPEDERYSEYIGKTAILPLLNREIPVIGDEYVDMEFGTGALKITPAHDFNDFEIGKKHGLDFINILNPDGTLSKEAGPYAGMERFESRKKVLEDLEESGLLEKVEDYITRIGYGQRTDTPVEPFLSKQWYVKTEPLAKEALAAVADGRTRIVPENWTKIYDEWLENIRDWCISRQLWWGHRIPIWYCQDCNEIICSMDDPDKCPKCGSTNLEQDKDVLDTWFSSQLWPFSTMGWPDQTDDLKMYYPTSVLVTGWDILFFWVARMMMAGLHFMDDAPFHTVAIHPLIADAEGKKMSKSKGNTLDPLDMMEKYGTDATRFTLVSLSSSGKYMRLSEEKFASYRNFMNKMWNAARFALMNLEDYDPQAKRGESKLEDRWILSRLNKAVDKVNGALTEYDFFSVAQTFYDFFWGEYCDWYIELTKSRLRSDNAGDKATAQHVLATVLETAMRLIHPVIPFISEEIWQRLPHEGQSIMSASYPVYDEKLVDEEAERKMQTINGVIRAIRNIRSDFQMKPREGVNVILKPDKDKTGVVSDNQNHIIALAYAELEIDEDYKEKGTYAFDTWDGVDVYVPATEEQISTIRAALEKNMSGANKEIERQEKRLSNKNFIDRAPEDIVEGAKENLARLKEEAEKYQKRLEVYGK